MICYVLAMGKQHLGPHVVVGYGIKILWPGLFITSPDHLDTLFTSSVFLLLTQDEFSDAFQGKKFHLETVCLFQKLVIGHFIRKSCFLDRLFARWLLRKS